MKTFLKIALIIVAIPIAIILMIALELFIGWLLFDVRASLLSSSICLIVSIITLMWLRR